MRPLIPIAIVAIGFFCVLLGTPPSEVRLSSYATPLEGRVKGQRDNAELSLDKINGVMIAPGAEFSFNKTVGTWSRDVGYRKAPVSFNGQLVWTWGGGVCQTSSTLYNAAILAGLEITERHRHRFAPGYVSPGRDAAVAYSNIDLCFKNPYPWPIKLAARIENDRLVCEVYGKDRLPNPVSIRQEIRSVREPSVFSHRSEGPNGRVMNPGKSGYSTATYRRIGETEELLSVDEYPPMNRVVLHTR